MISYHLIKQPSVRNIREGFFILGSLGKLWLKAVIYAQATLIKRLIEGSAIAQIPRQ